MLELKNICKSYGHKTALIDFSSELESGVYALLGPNGAGKSTLMNIITGNLRADSGEVLWDGIPAEKLGKDFKRILGFMPQQQGLYDSFTGRQFLMYMSALKGLSRASAKSETERTLALVNMTPEGGKRLGAYSGGMKQRILIAQAILGDPKLLIFDEPTAGLDPKERIRIRSLISRISGDKTVIIATHVVSDVEYIARQTLMLKDGRLIADDSPLALCSALKGQVFEAECGEEDVARLSHGRKVCNLFRSEHGITLRLVTDDPPDGAREVFPTLEDVYLSEFAGKDGMEDEAC